MGNANNMSGTVKHNNINANDDDSTDDEDDEDDVESNNSSNHSDNPVSSSGFNGIPIEIFDLILANN